MFLKKIENMIYINKYINHNKKFLDSNNNSNNIILVDQFNYCPSIIPISHFVERLKKKFGAQAVIYETFVDRSFFSKIKSFLKDYFKFGYLKIYESFGCRKKLYNKYDNQVVSEAEKKLKECLKNLKIKEDILKINIDNIYIGDLIYDTFLRTKKKPTINISDEEFKIFLFKFLKLFYFWKFYFDKNLNVIKALIVSHDVYYYAIPLRFAVKLAIPCYNVGPTTLYYFTKEKIRKKTGYDEFPFKFNILKKEISSKGKIEAEKVINDKFQGNLTFDIMINKFGKKNKIPKKILELENKKNVLIATHCFTDAVHAYGESIFPDYYEWLMFLGDKSNEKNFKWLLKPHPAQYKENYNFLKFFENKFKNFILIPNEVSNLDLIDKIFSVLTVYGSVGHEFPLFNIPVINASINNPHRAYNFNYHASTKEEYEQLINKIDTLKINSKEHKEKIYEYYYLNYLRDYYFFDNHLEILNKLRGRYSEPKIFDAWVQEYSYEKKLDIDKNLDRFIEEKAHRFYASDK